MQTFLPYPDFSDSVATLDQARLGKQRVEALQLLRAILLPSYGWQRHPVVGMWRGYLVGLAKYGVTATDAWIARGHSDTVRPLIVEFAPEVDRLTQADLAAAGQLPPWLGDEALHRSHRSNLIAKAPEFYRPQFPGTPEDLPYVWPVQHAEVAASTRPEGGGPVLEVIRVRTAGELEECRQRGRLTFGERSPSGRDTATWRAQIARFAELPPFTVVGVLLGNSATLALAEVTGPLYAVEDAEGLPTLARNAEFRGVLARSAVRVPATLQNPRSVFSVELVEPVMPVL